MADIPRICGMCGVDVTPLQKTPGLGELRTPRGRCIALVCHKCYPKGRKMIDKLAAMHGAYIVRGRYLSSPRGTPDIKSLDELKEAIACKKEGT